MHVDAVYVTSVRSFHDRRAHVARELQRHGIRFEFIDEFDPGDLKESAGLFARCGLEAPHKSLILKHLRAWQLACERRERRILVFEDDALLHRRFVPKLNEALAAARELPEGWLIYLGGADTKVPASFFRHRGPLIPQPIATAEAYVTDLEACRRRVAWCSAHQITLPADALIRRIDAEVGTAQFWLSVSLVEQGSVTGRFRSSLDAHRRKHSWLLNVLRNRWNKLQRRTVRKWWARVSPSP